MEFEEKHSPESGLNKVLEKTYSKEYSENYIEVSAKQFTEIESFFDKEQRNLILQKGDNDKYLDLCFVLTDIEIKALFFNESRHELNLNTRSTPYGCPWIFNIKSNEMDIGPDSFVIYSNELLKSHLNSLYLRINLINNKKTLKSYEIDANELVLIKEQFQKCFTNESNNETIFENSELQKYYFLAKSSDSISLDNKNKIKAQYANWLELIFISLKNYLDEVHTINFPKDFDQIKSPIFTEYFKIINQFKDIKNTLKLITELDTYFQKYSYLDLKRLLIDSFDIPENGLCESEEVKILYHNFSFFLEVYNFSPLRTKNGERLSYLSSESRKFELIDIEFDKVMDQVDGENYWETIFCDGSDGLQDIGYFVNGSDVPISNDKMIYGLKNIKAESSNEEYKKTYEDILDEALMHKEYMIPPGAIMEINIGPFNLVEIHEIGINVYFLFKNNTNNFYLGMITPRSKNVYGFHKISDIIFQNEANSESPVFSAFILLLCCIVRDFWVIENRESLFSTKIIKKRLGKKFVKEERIIYLPRIKYTKNPNYEKLESALNYASRKRHWVRASIRKSANASEFQKYLAKTYNVDLPEGYTFVRPHERGIKESGITKYRSRSALECLYDVSTKPNDGNIPEWLKFEKDMKKLFKNNLFEIEESKVSGNGDGGIDFIVRSKSEANKVWIVQCKCEKKKIGPNYIRELKGARDYYKTPANGVFITVNDYSEEAREVASDPDFNFFLIDKYNLQKYLKKPLSLKQDLELFYQ